jgi:hypothetical protein
MAENPEDTVDIKSETPDDLKEHEPRWDVIEKLHEKIDDDIDEAFRVNRLSFIEVDIALLMISEKLKQQKMEMYNIYFKQKENGEEEAEVKEAPDHLYK